MADVTPRKPAAQPCGFARFRQHRGSTGRSLRALASVYITARDTKTGRSFHVKYRLHGRYGKIEHAGAFGTMREARLRAKKVGEWIAEAKDPRVELTGNRASVEEPAHARGLPPEAARAVAS